MSSTTPNNNNNNFDKQQQQRQQQRHNKIIDNAADQEDTDKDIIGMKQYPYLDQQQALTRSQSRSPHAELLAQNDVTIGASNVNIHTASLLAQNDVTINASNTTSSIASNSPPKYTQPSLLSLFETQPEGRGKGRGGPSVVEDTAQTIEQEEIVKQVTPVVILTPVGNKTTEQEQEHEPLPSASPSASLLPLSSPSASALLCLTPDDLDVTAVPDDGDSNKHDIGVTTGDQYASLKRTPIHSNSNAIAIANTDANDTSRMNNDSPTSRMNNIFKQNIQEIYSGDTDDDFVVHRPISTSSNVSNYKDEKEIHHHTNDDHDDDDFVVLRPVRRPTRRYRQSSSSTATSGNVSSNGNSNENNHHQQQLWAAGAEREGEETQQQQQQQSTDNTVFLNIPELMTHHHNNESRHNAHNRQNSAFSSLGMQSLEQMLGSFDLMDDADHDDNDDLGDGDDFFGIPAVVLDKSNHTSRLLIPQPTPTPLSLHPATPIPIPTSHSNDEGVGAMQGGRGVRSPFDSSNRVMIRRSSSSADLKKTITGGEVVPKIRRRREMSYNINEFRKALSPPPPPSTIFNNYNDDIETGISPTTQRQRSGGSERITRPGLKRQNTFRTQNLNRGQSVTVLRRSPSTDKFMTDAQSPRIRRRKQMSHNLDIFRKQFTSVPGIMTSTATTTTTTTKMSKPRSHEDILASYNEDIIKTNKSNNDLDFDLHHHDKLDENIDDYKEMMKQKSPNRRGGLRRQMSNMEVFRKVLSTKSNSSPRKQKRISFGDNESDGDGDEYLMINDLEEGQRQSPKGMVRRPSAGSLLSINSKSVKSTDRQRRKRYTVQQKSVRIPTTYNNNSSFLTANTAPFLTDGTHNNENNKRTTQKQQQYGGGGDVGNSSGSETELEEVQYRLSALTPRQLHRRRYYEIRNKIHNNSHKNASSSSVVTDKNKLASNCVDKDNNNNINATVDSSSSSSSNNDDKWNQWKTRLIDCIAEIAIVTVSQGRKNHSNSTGWINRYLFWTIRSRFITVFLSAVLMFYFVAIVFAIFIYWIGNGHNNSKCIHVNGFHFDETPTPWVDAFSLSWTTLTTVGYGLVYPGTSTSITSDSNNTVDIGASSSYNLAKECTGITIVTTMEAFVGILFAALFGAIFFAKVSRVSSFAQVNFSDAIIIKYGTGVTGVVKKKNAMDTSPDSKKKKKYQEHEEHDDGISSDDDDASITTTTYKKSRLPCPFFEFRIVNKLHGTRGGEIIDASINIVVSIDEKTAEKQLHNTKTVNINRGTGARGRRRNRAKKAAAAADNSNKGYYGQYNFGGGDVDRDLFRNEITIKQAQDAVTRMVVDYTHAASVSAAAVAAVLSDCKIHEPDDDHHNEQQKENLVIPKSVFTKLHVESQEHPFFDRTWNVRHVLDHTSPIVRSEAKELIRLNNGCWPIELNNATGVRASINFEQILVSFSGTSNVDANSVYSQKNYGFDDVCVGYSFCNMLFHHKNGSIGVDHRLLNDVKEQTGDGGEILNFRRNRLGKSSGLDTSEIWIL